MWGAVSERGVWEAGRAENIRCDEIEIGKEKIDGCKEMEIRWESEVCEMGMGRDIKRRGES